MQDTMKSLFENIKNDEWVWMEQMITTHETLLPEPLRNLPLVRQVSKLMMVVALVPVGAASLIRNLPDNPAEEF